jgi:hypothetical protein
MRSSTRFLPKAVALTSALAILTAPVPATSVIVDVKTDRILIVADSRAVQVNLGGYQVRDDKCKIIVLGNRIAFTETGREGYTPLGPWDTVPEWHGTSEAVNAYSNVQNHDLYTVASTWSIQVTKDFERLYLSDPQKVRGLAVQGILLAGIFAGENSQGILTAYLARVALDDTLQAREGTLIPIGHAVDQIPPKDEPYTTNGVTQELLEGKTDRAKQVAKLWAKKSRHIPLARRKLRWLEFLIEQTADYDSEVHAPINALQIKNNSVTWLQNETCRKIEAISLKSTEFGPHAGENTADRLSLGWGSVR